MKTLFFGLCLLVGWVRADGYDDYMRNLIPKEADPIAPSMLDEFVTTDSRKRMIDSYKSLVENREPEGLYPYVKGGGRGAGLSLDRFEMPPDKFAAPTNFFTAPRFERQISEIPTLGRREVDLFPSVESIRQIGIGSEYGRNSFED